VDRLQKKSNNIFQNQRRERQGLMSI